VFSLFDKDEDGVVKVTDIGPMLRSIGFNPSEDEIERLHEEQDTDNGITSRYDNTGSLNTPAISFSGLVLDPMTGSCTPSPRYGGFPILRPPFRIALCMHAPVPPTCSVAAVKNFSRVRS